MSVAVGSIFSVVNYILSINIFTLVSWVSLIGFAFKFLRKEYVNIVFLDVMYRLSGAVLGICRCLVLIHRVMDMQDDDDIIPILRNKDRRMYYEIAYYP